MHHHQGDGGRRRECTTLFYYRSSNTNHTLVCVSVRVGKQRVNDVGSVYSSILPYQHHLHINFETHKKVCVFIYIQIPYCTPHEDYARHGILKIYITKSPTTAINCSYSSHNNSETLVRSFGYGEEKECAPSYTVTAPIDSMKRPHSELSTHNEEGEEEHPHCENPEETITPTDSRTSSNLPTGTTTPTDEDVVSLPPPQRTPSPPSLPPSPPPPTILESQQHPKILGFHVFSSKRNLKRQRSMSSISTTATTTIAASNNLDRTEHSTTDTPIAIAITNDSTTTNNNNTAATSSSSTMDWLLPISVLQRIYEHIPLPPIQPVTDEELVRYTMVSVNAIRNGDVALLRQILRQKQPPPPLLSSSSSSRSHHHDGHQNSDTSTTTTTLSWFDGRNRNGESLLHLACRRSTVDVVQFLIHEAQVNMTMTDLYGRTCLHDICWRPRVEEAIPIFHVVRQHYMSTLQQKRMEEQQERWSTNNNNSNHESNSTTSTPSSSLVQWLSMWPFQPDIRGHVCFDYCRQEHWYEWNTYLQEQIQKDMAVNMETTTHVPPETETTIATTTLEEAADVTHEEKSSLWCTIG